MPPLHSGRPKDPRPPQHRGTRVSKSPNIGDAPKSTSDQRPPQRRDSVKKDPNTLAYYLAEASKRNRTGQGAKNYAYTMFKKHKRKSFGEN